MYQPLEQFSLKLTGISFTNFSSIMFLLIIMLVFIVYITCHEPTWFLSGLFDLVDSIIGFVRSILLQQSTNSHIFIYFPLLMSMACLILFSNLYGLIPYGFTLTSHIYATLSWALSFFIGITIVGFITNGCGFFYFLVPSGVENIGLLLFLVLIEVVSYLIRPLSLSIRLFANMLAGHTSLFISTGAVLSIHKYNFYLVVFLPLFIVSGIVLLEIGIAFIQCYVFTILLIIYLVDMYIVVSH